MNNNYALCMFLEKIPSSDDFANILELLHQEIEAMAD
jgi:hypothetical protein